MPRRCWPASRPWSTCAPSCSAAPAGPGWAACADHRRLRPVPPRRRGGGRRSGPAASARTPSWWSGSTATYGRRRDYRVEFVAEPISWTEAPVTAGVLGSQRRRWHRGLWETLWKHRGMMGNPRYGRIGWWRCPTTGSSSCSRRWSSSPGWCSSCWACAGVVDVAVRLRLPAVAYGYALLVALAAITVEELPSTGRPLAGPRATLARVDRGELGYRQLTAWWRLQGWWAGSPAGRRSGGR